MPSTTNFGWTTPADTDLVKDGAAAIRTLGNGIDTSFLDLKGGTSGQVLAKNSNTDLDFVWVAQDDSNAIQNAIVDAKGDLISATAADTPARLAVGTNGHILTADSSTSTGLKWAAPAGGGKVLQVVSATYSTATSSTSETYADTGLTASITPSSATSKVLILTSQQLYVVRSSDEVGGCIRIMRDATSIYDPFGNRGAPFQLVYSSSQNGAAGIVSYSYLDSPSTTSATTYKTQLRVKNAANSSTATVQENSSPSSIILLEIGA